MALYRKLVDTTGALVIFGMLLNEVARGVLTGAEIAGILTTRCRISLTEDERQQAAALLASVKAGASQYERLMRAQEITDVLYLALLRAPGYDTPEAVLARLTQ